MSMSMIRTLGYNNNQITEFQLSSQGGFIRALQSCVHLLKPGFYWMKKSADQAIG